MEKLKDVCEMRKMGGTFLKPFSVEVYRIGSLTESYYSASMLHRLTPSVSPGNLLEMQSPGSQPQSTESELHLEKIPGDVCAR